MNNTEDTRPFFEQKAEIDALLEDINTPIDTEDVELDEILEDFYDGDIRRSDMGKAKQAVIDWHNKRKLEARIDSLEYAKISPKYKIEEKIEQLRLELNKYE